MRRSTLQTLALVVLISSAMGMALIAVGTHLGDLSGSSRPARRRTTRGRGRDSATDSSSSVESSIVIPADSLEDATDCTVTPEVANHKDGGKLILASHQRLVMYDPVSNECEVLDEGRGIYFGVFSTNGGRTIWVSLRSYDEEARESDALVELDLTTRRVVREVNIAPSRFTHDATYSPLTKRIYVADTAHGDVHVFSATSMKRVGVISGLFTSTDHINTLRVSTAVDGDDAPRESLWCILLNGKNRSFASEIDPQTRVELRRVKDLGKHAHGWARWNDGSYLYLSSREMKLMRYFPDRDEKVMVWQEEIPQVEEASSVQRGPFANATVKSTSSRWVRRALEESDANEKVNEENVGEKKKKTKKKRKKMFLKGLAVAGAGNPDVVYVGVSPFTDRPKREFVASTLVALDIKKGQVLWRRGEKEIGTRGLLNTVTTFSSLIESRDDDDDDDDSVNEIDSTPSCNVQAKVSRSLTSLDQYARLGWSFGYLTPPLSFVEMPLTFDAKRLAADVEALVAKYGWTLRADVNNYFILLATKGGEPQDQSNEGPYLPVPGRFETAPYLTSLVASLGCVIGRTRLMMLKPGENVKLHVDRTSHIVGGTEGKPDVAAGYWGRRFRIHIPVVTNPMVKFTSGETEIHMESGKAYVFDNSQKHAVVNPSNYSRIHLVVDTVGSLATFELMRRGRFHPPQALPRLPPGVEEDAGQPVTVVEGKIPVFERWRDAPVFTPMPVEELRDYLSYAASLVDLEDGDKRDRFAEKTGEFLRRWEAAELASSLERLRELREEFLSFVLSLEACEKGKKSAPRRAPRVVDAVEPILRMAYYECVGWGKHPEAKLGPPCVASTKVVNG